MTPRGAAVAKGNPRNNKIRYDNAFPDASLEYQVTGTTVKEQLILNKKPTASSFRFNLRLKDVTPKERPDGGLDFVNADGGLVWTMPKPFMVDKTGKISENVRLALLTEGGTTAIDLIADETFLQAADTQYPVIIDPTLHTWDVMVDTFVSSAAPAASFDGNVSMFAGAHATYGTTRSLVSFYLPTLPSDSRIDSASFHAYQTGTNTATSTVDLHRVTAGWTGSGATWNAQPAVGVQADATVANAAANTYWSWTVTPLVKDWYNGNLPNYGMMLRMRDETAPARSFNTVNSVTNTPRLTITYTVDPIGHEEYWTKTPNHVNPANGNYIWEETDINVTGLGPETLVRRTYNSRKTYAAGLFGYGWTSTLDRMLVSAGKGPVTYIDEDGTRHIFGEQVGGGYQNATVNVSMTKLADGTYTTTDSQGTVTRYNTAGRMTAIVDSNGNTLTVAYGTNGKPSTITDASGRVTTLAYAANGFVSSITDPAQRTVRYDYDTAGNMIKASGPETNASTYTYDAAHKMTSQTNARGVKRTIVYDAENRVTSVSSPITAGGTATTATSSLTYSPATSVTSFTDEEGRRTDYTYNPNGNVVRVVENAADTANQIITTYTYDNANRLTQLTDPNANRAGTTDGYVYQYDENGNVTGTQLPMQQNASFGYTNNNLTREEDFEQNVSTYGYDAEGNQTRATDPYVQTVSRKYAANGNLLYFTNPMSVADNPLPNSSYELDANADGWPDGWTRTTEPGKTASFSWAAGGRFGNRAVTISNPTGWATVGSDTTVPYTGKESYVVSGYVKTANATGTAVLKMEYLSADNSFLGQQIAYPLKGTNDWTRLQAVLDKVPAGTAKVRVSVGMNAGTGSVTFDGIQLEQGHVIGAYNLIENASLERDTNGDNVPDAWATSNNLTASDRLVTDAANVYAGRASFALTGEAGKNKFLVQRLNVSGNANTPLTLAGWSKQAGANPAGGAYQLQVAINYTSGATDWSFANSYSPTDGGWQLVGVDVRPKEAFSSVDVYYQFYNQTGTAYFDAMRLETGSSFTSHTYDPRGNYVTSTRNQAGDTASFAYDAVGNRTSMTDGKKLTTSYGYNALNQLTRVTDPMQAVTQFTYDSAGNQTSRINANNRTTGYEYNEYNLLSRMTDPLNRATSYRYDKYSNLTGITYPNGAQIANTYNALNRLTSISYNGTKAYDFTYDPNWNLTSVTDTAGAKTTYAYDRNNRITEMVKGAVRTGYGYDNNNNLTGLDLTSGGKTMSLGLGYNALNQQLTISRNGTNQARFLYDERGNIISIIRVNGTYSGYEFDSANRVQSVRNYDAAGTLLSSYRYTYDPNDNPTSLVTAAGTINYTYDNANRLTGEAYPDGTTITHAYDAVGNRTQRTVTKGGTATATAYTYDAADQLTSVNGQACTYDANGNLTGTGARTYAYNADNRLLEVRTATGPIATFTYDHEGRRNSLTAGGTTLYQHYFGNKIIAETDAAGNIVNEFTWDAKGRPITWTRNGTIYYYQLNAHNDVVAVTDASGATVASYSYDAYGNALTQTGALATANPLRYSSYYFDQATGLYYLTNRYYDPGIGRFLSRDRWLGSDQEPDTLNPYTYAYGNPVIYSDPDGHPDRRSDRRFARLRRLLAGVEVPHPLLEQLAPVRHRRHSGRSRRDQRRSVRILEVLRTLAKSDLSRSAHRPAGRANQEVSLRPQLHPEQRCQDPHQAGHRDVGQLGQTVCRLDSRVYLLREGFIRRCSLFVDRQPADRGRDHRGDPGRPLSFEGNRDREMVDEAHQLLSDLGNGHLFLRRPHSDLGWHREVYRSLVRKETTQ